MKKKLNIGIFTYDFFPIFGGQGRHVHEIYKQNLLHNDVTMYIFSPNINEFKNHISTFPETKNSKFKNIEYSVKLHNVFEKLIKKYSLNIVHIHGGPGGIFLFKKLSVPTIYTSHHTYWQQYTYIKSQSWKYLFYLLERRSYKLADKIICVSIDTKKILLNHYGVSESKLSYIPNGINLDKFEERKKFVMNSKNILYVGRLDKRKGINFLIETMKTLKNSHPEIFLHVIGDGKIRKHLESLSKRDDLSIKFYGYISDSELEKIYPKMSIQIVPSMFEGFGISVLEGMANGLPIIATNVDGIRSIIKNNKTGLLVNYGDVQSLSKAILKLLNNKKLKKVLNINSQVLLKNYDWNKIYLKTIDLYEMLASKILYEYKG
ncbi:MAG TPA: glycosyltransferase family 4 protein [Candidatus Eisenbacteria bacterium]|nr:glycosyltransferase family 4 protein [Candidatus Eisenbacteria bacterium]